MITSQRWRTASALDFYVGLVIWEPKAEIIITQSETAQSHALFLWEGRRVKGVSCTVLLRGKMILESRACVGTFGEGAFLRPVRVVRRGRG